MLKIHLVLWTKKTGDPIEDFFLERPEYYYFFRHASEQFEFRIAYGKESHAGKGVFADVWRLEDGRLVPGEQEFSADIIYQRKPVNIVGADFGSAKIIDTPEFRAFSRDKFKVYQLLKEFSPVTRLAQSLEEIREAIMAITGDRVIVKPRHGEKGEGVLVWEKQQPFSDNLILKEKLDGGGYLVQSFADTSYGIPGVVNGVHDLKFLNIGDSVFANLRTPARDGVICTYDSPYTEVPIDTLPKGLLEFRARVHTLICAKFPHQLYSMDVGNTAQGPILFEINGHTAFPYIHFSYTPAFVEALLTHFKMYVERSGS